jgi:hypothetical protein
MRNYPALGRKMQVIALAGLTGLVVMAGGTLAKPAFAADEAGQAAQLAKAREAIKGLGGNLKKELVGAMEKGGPVSAIDICRTAAPSIAEAQSQQHGVEVARTALKVRNPKNAADEFERRVLEDFVKKIEAGSDPAMLDYSETVTAADGSKEFRYMKAIPTAEKPCLACHGENIAPEVKAEIDRLYPEDEATGFKAGELRGAFTVTQKVE